MSYFMFMHLTKPGYSCVTYCTSVLPPASITAQVFRFCIENSIEEKVIEKAYKKLRLDALVIQQGRLTENQGTKVNKDDLLNMVRYGAELVFSSEASSITGGCLLYLLRNYLGRTSSQWLHWVIVIRGPGVLTFFH